MKKSILISACLGISLTASACSRSSSKPPAATPAPAAANKSPTPAPASSTSGANPTSASTSQSGTAVGANGFCTPQVIVDRKALDNKVMAATTDFSNILQQVMDNQSDPTVAKNQMKVDVNVMVTQAKAFKAKYGDFACNVPGPGGTTVLSSSDVDQAISQMNSSLAQLN